MRIQHHHCSRLCAAVLVMIGAGTSLAADVPSAAVVKPLLTESLAGIPGKEALMLTVEYLPGGASLPHRHDADVFVYVLEGSLIMQVDGQQPVTLHAGQTFHERPSDIHRKSANASATEPAKFLVFIVKDKNKPVSTPVSP
jgi:quercetin dioxygenase-like cupin family protein